MVAAIVGAATVVGSVASGAMQSSAAKKASNAQIDAQQQAMEEQRQASDKQIAANKATYQDSVGNLAPWQTTGESALSQISDLYGLNAPAAAGAPAPFGGAGAPKADPNAGMLAVLQKQYGNASAADVAAGQRASDLVNGQRYFFDQFYDPTTNTITNPAAAKSYFDNLVSAVPSYGQLADQTNTAANAALAPAGPQLTQQQVTQQTQDRQKNAMSKFFTSPDYQFRMSEGTKALDNSAASRGLLLSGGQTKAVQEYGGNLASGEFSNYFNKLAGIADAGQAAATSQNALGATYAGLNSNLTTNTANNIATGLGNQGDARASGYIGAANANSNALGGVANGAALYAGLKQSNALGSVGSPMFNPGASWTNPDTGRVVY